MAPPDYEQKAIEALQRAEEDAGRKRLAFAEGWAAIGQGWARLHQSNVRQK